MVKNPSANAGDMGSIPGSGRFPGDGNGTQIPWTEEPADYSPWGHKRAGHDLATEQQQLTVLFTKMRA